MPPRVPSSRSSSPDAKRQRDQTTTDLKSLRDITDGLTTRLASSEAAMTGMSDRFNRIESELNRMLKLFGTVPTREEHNHLKTQIEQLLGMLVGSTGSRFEEMAADVQMLKTDTVSQLHGARAELNGVQEEIQRQRIRLEVLEETSRGVWRAPEATAHPRHGASSEIPRPPDDHPRAHPTSHRHAGGFPSTHGNFACQRF